MFTDVGYDAGDTIWDTDKARSSLAGLLQTQVDKFYKKSAIESMEALDLHANQHMPGLSIKTVKCQSKSMVEASNCVIEQLYKDGAEYWVSTRARLATNWISRGVSETACADSTA